MSQKAGEAVGDRPGADPGGALELLGAVGLIMEQTRRAAGLCLVALFVLLLPANVYEAVADISFAGEPPSPLWQRIPEQILYIGFALWAALTSPRSSLLSSQPQRARRRETRAPAART